MTTTAVIDERAPVAAEREIEIAAPRETVWDVLTTIDAWPTWDPNVAWTSVDGEVVEGSRFRWKAGPGTITSTLERVEAPALIAWTGRTLGIDAVHVWRLESRNGSTLVTTEETYDGLVARVFRGRLQKTLENALESGLRNLKAEAERTAGLRARG